jgi:hypothetical protein
VPKLSAVGACGYLALRRTLLSFWLFFDFHRKPSSLIFPALNGFSESGIVRLLI